MPVSRKLKNSATVANSAGAISSRTVPSGKLKPMRVITTSGAAIIKNIVLRSRISWFITLLAMVSAWLGITFILTVDEVEKGVFQSGASFAGGFL